MNAIQRSAREAERLVFLVWFLLCAAAHAQVPPTIVWQSQATNDYALNPVALPPDGSVIATLGTNNSVQICRTSDGLPVTALLGHSSWIGDLAFSPDGGYLASGGGDRSVRVWRTADWSLAYSVPSASQGPPVAFSPDSAIVAIGSGTVIELLRATNGAVFQTWTATTGEMKALAFSPDGTRLASGAGFRGMDTALKIWEVPSGALLRSVPTAQTYSVGRVVFSPDGQQILTGSEYLNTGPLQSWRVSDGLLLRTFPLEAYAMAYSADGAVLAAVGTNIMFFRASDGALMQEYSDGWASSGQGEKGIALTSFGWFVRSRCLGEVLVGRVPVLISAPGIQGSQLNIRWVGGSGRYQLQRAAEIGGAWQDEGGVLTTNSVNLSPATPSSFYRVVALPQ